MNKNELQSEIDAITLELRSLMDSVKDTSKEINPDEVRAKKEELEQKRSKLEKELAEMDRPTEPKAEKRSLWGELAQAMFEKRALTLNGTGTALTLKELDKARTNRPDILNRARFFYGPNAATNIPVWASHMSAEFVADGGSVSAAQNKSIAATSITAKQAMSSLPVSKMALDLSAAAIEAELPDLFGTAFDALMATEMLTGNGTNMQGIFTDSNITAYTKTINVVDLAGLAITVRAKDYVNPCIVMSPTVYAAFLADNATDETTKLYKESIIRDKSIEGVPLVITAFAPTTTTSGSVVAVAGDLSNYAIGVAGEITVQPKGTAGASYTTFDAISYFSGKPVISADFIGYTVAS